MAEFDAAKVFKTTADQDPLTGPGLLGSNYADFCNNSAKEFLKNSFVIRNPMSPTEFEYFREFTQGSPVILSKTLHAISHVRARMAQNWLQKYFFDNFKLNGFSILLVGCSKRECDEMVKAFPLSKIFAIFGSCDDRDKSRLDAAYLASGKYSSNPSQEFRRLYRKFKNGSINVSSANMAIMKNFLDFAGNADVVVAFDCLYDIAPDDLRKFQFKIGAITTLFTMHMPGELFTSNANPMTRLKNPVFGITWRVERRGVKVVGQTWQKVVSMTFDDESPAYTSSYKVLKQWSTNKFVNGLIWEPVYHNFGYGLFRTSISSVDTYRSVKPYVSTKGKLIRAFNVPKFLNTMELEDFYIDYDKYMKGLNYGVGSVKIDERIDPMKMLVNLRGSEGKQHVGGVTVSKAWDLMDSNLMNILYFLIFDVSLHRMELSNVLRSLGKFFRLDGVFQQFWHDLECYLNRIKRFVFGESFQEWFQAYKNMEVVPHLQFIGGFTKAKKKLFNPKLYSGIIFRISILTKEEWKVYEEFKKIKGFAGNSPFWTNHSQQKLTEILSFVRGCKELHDVGCAPGGFSKFFSDKDMRVTEYLFEGEKRFEMNLSNVDYSRPLYTFGSSASDFKSFDDFPSLNGGLISDAAHCNESDCLVCRQLLFDLVSLVAKNKRLGVAVIKTNLKISTKNIQLIQGMTLFVFKSTVANPMCNEHFLVYSWKLDEHVIWNFKRFKHFTLTWASNLSTKLRGYVSLSPLEKIRFITKEERNAIVSSTCHDFVKYWHQFEDFLIKDCEKKILDLEKKLDEPKSDDSDSDDDDTKPGDSKVELKETDLVEIPLSPVMKESKLEVIDSEPPKPLALAFAVELVDKFKGWLRYIKNITGLTKFSLADVGSGDSNFAAWVRSEGYDCISYDINGKADVTLDVSKQIPANTFDVVLLNMSFHHIGPFNIHKWLNSDGFVVLREHIIDDKTVTAELIRKEHIDKWGDSTVNYLIKESAIKHVFEDQGLSLIKQITTKRGNYSVWLCYRKSANYDNWRELLLWDAVPNLVPKPDCEYKKFEYGVILPVPDHDVERRKLYIYEAKEDAFDSIKNLRRIEKNSYPFRHTKIIDVYDDGYCYFWAAQVALGRMASELVRPNRNPSISQDFVLRMAYVVPTVARIAHKGKWYWIITSFMTNHGWVYADFLNSPDHVSFLACNSVTEVKEQRVCERASDLMNKYIAVDVGLTVEQFHTVKQTVLDDFDLSEPMYKWMTSNDLTSKMLDKRMNFYNPSRTKLNLTVIDGDAGFGKTYILAKIMVEFLNHDIDRIAKVGYFVSKRLARDEFLSTLWKFLDREDKAYWRQYQKRIDTSLIKTHQVMMTKHSTQLELLLGDECFTVPTYAIIWFAHAFPNCKMVLAGGSNQIGADKECFPNWNKPDMFETDLSLFIQKYPQEVFVHKFDYTMRSGIETIRLLRALKVEGADKMHTAIIKPTKIMVHDWVTKNIKDGTYWMYQSKKAKWFDESCSSMHTVASSQGVSEDRVSLIVPEKGFFNMSEMYVAFSRHKLELHIYPEYGKQLLYYHGIMKEIYRGGFVGGTFRPASDYVVKSDKDHRHFIMPSDPFKNDIIDSVKEMAAPWKAGAIPFEPSLKEYSLVPKTRPLFEQTFTQADLITLNGNLSSYDANIPSMIYMASNMKDSTIYAEKLINKEFEVKQLNSAVEGKRHYSNSMVQSINTLVGRLSTALNLQKKANKRFESMTPAQYDSFMEKLKLRFFLFYIDSSKYEEILNSALTDTVLVEVWNEFLRTINWNGNQCENIVSNRFQFMQGMLKQQMKVKGKEAPYENKGGQPIAAVSKVTVALYALLFRFMVRLIRLSLHDKYKMATGMSNQEIAEWLEAHMDNVAQIFMTDAKEFDASQNKYTQSIVKMCFSFFCPDLDRLGSYYAQIGKTTVFYIIISIYWGDSKPSGAPDTLDGNVVLCMVLVMTLYPDGTIEFAIFLGDDTGVGLNKLIYVLNTKVYDLFFSFPLKVNTHPRVLEFCNHLFGRGTFVYNPYVLAAKVLQKDYRGVLETRAKWEEWRESLKVVFWTVRKDFYKVLDLCTDYFGTSREDMELLLVTLDNYIAMSYDDVRKNLHFSDLVLSDEIVVGGNRVINLSHYSTAESSEMNFQTIVANTIRDTPFSIDNHEVSHFGPPDSMTWVSSLIVKNGSTFVKKFQATSPQKALSIQQSFKSVLDFLNEWIVESKKPKAITSDVAMAIAVDQAVKPLREELAALVERIKLLENQLSKTLNEGFAWVESINNNSATHSKNGNIMFRTFLKSLSSMDMVFVFIGDDVSFTVPLEVYDSFVNLAPPFECGADELAFWLKSITSYVNNKLIAKTPSFIAVCGMATLLGFDSQEIAVFMSSHECVLSMLEMFHFSDDKLNDLKEFYHRCLGPIEDISKVFKTEAKKHNKEVHSLNGNSMFFRDIDRDSLNRDFQTFLDQNRANMAAGFGADYRVMTQVRQEYCRWMNELDERDRSYGRVKAAGHNRAMHALNGNQSQPMPQRPKKVWVPRKATVPPKVIAKEVKKEVKKDVKAIVPKRVWAPKKKVPNPQIARMTSIPRTIASLKIKSSIKKLLGVVMLPFVEGKPGVGWPRAMSDISTNKHRLEKRIPAGWDPTAVSPPYSVLDRTQIFGMALRSFLCHFILYFYNGASAHWAYLMYGFDGSTNTRTLNSVAFEEFVPFRFFYGLPTGATVASQIATWTPHGDMWFAGSTEAYPQHCFYWFQRGDPVDTTSGGTHATLPIKNMDADQDMWLVVTAICYTQSAGYKRLVLYDGEVLPLATASVTLSGGQLDDTVFPYGAYVAFEAKTYWYAAEAPNVHTVSVFGYDYSMAIDSKSSTAHEYAVFGHQCHPAAITLSRVLKQGAITGCSLWYENIAADSYKNGEIAVQQLPANEDWTTITQDYSSFLNQPKTKVFKAARGTYSYLKPNTINSFDLKSEITSSGVYVTSASWRIDGDQDKLICIPTVTNTSVGISQAGLWRIGSNFELVATDPLFPCTPCLGSTLDADRVLDLTRNQVQHFENASHLKKIGGFLNKVANATKKGLALAEPFIDLMI